MRTHIRSNIVGYLALFLVITGGTAYALEGSNTVFSDDIVDGEVTTDDIDNNGVRSADVRVDSLVGDDIAQDSITGAEIATDSVRGVDLFNVTGEDIIESTLAEVPSATVADTANAAFSTFYNARIPWPNSFGDPANPIVTLDVPAGSYVISAKLSASNLSGASMNRGGCVLSAGSDFDTTGIDLEDWGGLDGSRDGDQEVVAHQLVHTFSSPGRVTLDCTDNGEGAVGAHDTRITAVQVASISNVPFAR